ncbi:amino acid ABC transporter substrate-binding protein (PAAT family) [Crenobacter luteus]|nr:amino acid ABC transporter substrate-binding protein (PAAT family) [Crenobacter luteus]
MHKPSIFRLPPRLFAAGVVSCLTMLPASAGERLDLATEEYPPYQMSERGFVTGFVSDKLREALGRAGLEARFDVLPWKRALQFAAARSGQCVYSTTRTPERAARFKWVGPLAQSEWVLYALAERRLSIARLEDARPYRIGSYNGDARDTYLRERGYTVETALDDLSNPQKLLSGRIDLWVTDRYSTNRFVQQNGWRDSIVPVLRFRRVDLYLACHPATPDATLQRLQAALDAMRQDGTAARIEQRYANWPER